MFYEVTPAGFASVESGHKKGPPLQAETAPATAADVFSPDSTKDIVVISLVNDYKLAKAGYVLGRKMSDDLSDLQEECTDKYGLHVQDASKLCLQLLFNLASCGDKHCIEILKRLSETGKEVRKE